MRTALWLATLVFALSIQGEQTAGRQALSYSAASIVNAATNVAGALAPNSIATVYGAGLSYTTKALGLEDVNQGTLPTVLAGTGVRVLVGSAPAHIYYVSPTQINFLIPPILRAGEAEFQITLDGRAGPAIRITLLEAAPGLFAVDGESAVATRADGSLVSKQQPARPGEVVVLYATGLGRTLPDVLYGRIPTSAAPVRATDLQVILDGVAVDRSNILYAGVTPGFAGLYQINLKLPANVAADPEVRVSLAGQISPAGVRLAVKPD